MFRLRAETNVNRRLPIINHIRNKEVSSLSANSFKPAENRGQIVGSVEILSRPVTMKKPTQFVQR